MSIVKMRKTVRKQIKIRMFGRTFEMGSAMGIIFWIIVIIFLAGTYYMYGPSGGPAGPEQSAGVVRQVSNVVAEVDGRPVNRNEYEMALWYSQRSQNSSDVTRERSLKTGVLDMLVDRELQRAAARAEGIKISGADIGAKKDEIVADIIANQYSDKAVLRRVLQDRNMSLDEFKRDLRSNSERMPEDADIRESLVFEKLQASIEDIVQVTEAQVKDSYAEVHASHILISPDAVRAEAMPEVEEGEEPESTPEPMTEEQAKAEAQRIAEDLKRQIDEGADFAALAKEHSDDPGSGMNGGDLDWFTRDRMVKEFSDVAFTLEPGQVSDPVESQFGFHVIKVEETRQDLPEDFEENKEQYTEEVAEQLRGQAWEEYQQQLRDAANIEIIDLELQAYKLLEDDPAMGAAQAAALLAAAAEADPRNASARYELASLLDQAGQTDEAISVLTELTETEEGAKSPQVRLRLGQMLKDAGQNESALDHLRSASEWAQGFDYPNYFVHMQLQRLFEEMESPEDAAREQQWIDDFQAQMGGGGMSMPGVINVD